MKNEYIPNFASLTIEEINYLAAAVDARHSEFHAGQGGDYENGEELFHHCDSCGLDHADVVMCLAKDPSAVAVVILEKLVGQPIKREAPKQTKTAAPRKRGAAVRRTDPRIITNIQPNPKRPGSKSYPRYELYVEGMTVTQAFEAGLNSADIKWDSERGFITLEDPKS